MKLITVCATLFIVCVGCKRTAPEPTTEQPVAPSIVLEQKVEIVEAAKPSGIIGTCITKHVGGPYSGEKNYVSPTSTHPSRELRGEIKPEGKEERIAVVSDRYGQFRVDLPPGRYVFFWDTGNEEAFEVEVGKFTEKTFTSISPRS